MTVRLVVTTTGQDPVERVFDQAAITFGRSAENDLPLEDQERQVSSRHGRIEKRGASYWAVDLGSTNGTAVNGVAVDPGPGVELRDGDTLEVGACQIRFTAVEIPAEAEQTMVRFDAARHGDKLADRLAELWATLLHEAPERRLAALRRELETEVSRIAPDHARAVLARVAGRFAAGAASEPGAEPERVDRHEELYRAGHTVLAAIAARFVDADDRFRSAQDTGRFGRLLEQTLDLTLEWLAKCLRGREEFETQFGADVTMVFSRQGNPIKNGRSPEEIGRFLLDWRSDRQVRDVGAILEEAYEDLTLHQLGLLAGSQEAIKVVLQRLDPKLIEALAEKKQRGLLGMLAGGGKEWSCYKEIYQEIFEEKSSLFEGLISPAISKGYLEAHDHHLQAKMKTHPAGGDSPS